MSTMSFKLNRRAVLKGTCGVAVALPALEVMLNSSGTALAQGTPLPKRYLVFFDGQSLGGDGDPLRDDYVPVTVGPNYDLKSALAPLGPDNIKNEVSVVSGLNIPTANGGAVPAGGRRDDFHVSSLSPLLSGVKSGAGTAAMGPTSDQLVADAIAGTTPFKSLVYRVQVGWYLSVAEPAGRDAISYKAGAGGKPLVIQPQVSPKAAFDALFGNFTPPMNDTEAKKRDFDLRARQSVLDLVRGSCEKLIPRLGAADKVRMQQHMDEIRDLEKRIAALPPPAAGACQKPTTPGADPAAGGNQPADTVSGSGFDINTGYSGEEERARAFCDLIHMAYACDLSRSGSLQMTMFQSHMNMYALTGARCDLHEIGHGGDPVQKGTLGVSKAIAWHVKHFAYLVGKFRDTAEGQGKLLDNSVMVFLNEGGHGLDTSSAKINSSHSTENMACLIAGRAGGLKPGKHVAATGKHPANVLITAMNAVGVPGNLGEVSGNIPELLT
jgi:Protein of unknown function (DUF1552)